ncbi:histidyl-tRNA synthetase, mitochondrial precursor [Akanthomyces lecanii RCEF 1005]|uniref:histidine--tRNA ligase n=1 Tax=Akanthomyces lecanii RCEF 1005 TaxID=1081108 RepID=A0A168HI62_CORDF|nr:histidyl-tRNA synthetase, mitochondrial precursor [Akanthomyces lecanii RCEF 1005]
MASKNTTSSSASSRLKTPKGTKDWVGQDLLLRDQIFQSISEVFKRHGGVPLDTPVFELRDVLTGKYGEDARLIYNLEDQGGEILSLRYDLTVPFARWLAMRTDVKQIKRYQIAKVYRRDQPAIARGRLREFYQCDFDIAGIYDPMIPEAEILRVVVEAFRGLDMNITIKLNHRRILDGLFAVSGVPADKIRAVSSAVDKLDKEPWEAVKKEMVGEKGVAEDVADCVGNYIQQRAGMGEMLELLAAQDELANSEDIQAGIKDMRLLMSYLKAMDVLGKVSFDLSLARGLDYYTGLIYEVIMNEPNQVGSVAAGGRYDNLVGMYGKQQIPCIGVSFGIERIFTVLKQRQEKSDSSDFKRRPADVYIIAAGGKDSDGFLIERMIMACELWDAGIEAEYSAKAKPTLQPQFNASKDVPIVIMMGQEELATADEEIGEKCGHS